MKCRQVQSATEFNVAHLQAIKDHYKTEYADGSKGQVRTLQTIAQGINLTRGSWVNLQAAGSARMQSHIQGGFDTERLKQSLNFISGSGIIVSDDIVNGINQWIDQKSETELRNFLAYINGSPAISSRGITINVGSRYTSVVAHSCFSAIDIPSHSSIAQITRVLDDYCVDNTLDSNFDRS